MKTSNTPRLVFGLISLAFAGNASAALTTYYRMDETAGSTLHDAVGTSDAQLHNGVTFQASNLGNAIRLNGINQYGRAATFPKPTTTETITAWAYLEGPYTIWQSVAKNWGHGRQGAFHLGLDWFGGTDNMGAYLSDNAVGQRGPSLDSNPFPIMQWTHVGMIANGSTFAVYVNGERVGPNVNYSGVLAGEQKSLGIGVKIGDNDVTADPNYPGYWHGMLDDLGIYNTALPSGHMRAVYRLGLPSSASTFDLSKAYDLGEANQIFVAYSSASSTSIGPDFWSYTNGLNAIAGATPEGGLFIHDGDTYLLLSTAGLGTGMQLIPEPSTTSLVMVLVACLPRMLQRGKSQLAAPRIS